VIQYVNSSSRVALVTGGLKLGGSTTFLCNLAGELVRRGIATEVLSFEKQNPLATDFERQGIPVICFDDRRFIFEDRMQWVLEELRHFKPTVVISTLAAPSFEVQRYMPSGIFRVAVAQSDDPALYPGIAQYAAHLDAVAVVSREMKWKMEAQSKLVQHPVHYLAYGIPISEQTREPNSDIQQPLRILYLGRLEREQKRVHLFPQILEQLKVSGIPFHWTIAGDGSEKTALERAMKSAAPTQTVSFPGQISYAQVPEIVRMHDVCLITSDYEGFGLSVLEGMEGGLVPVVSDLPAGIPEMVDKTTGILVPVDDVAGYARGIIHLHEHRDELAAKSMAARERVKTRFSVEAMADRWLSIFPKTFPVIDEWPEHWKIQPPLPARHPLYFSTPMRIIRRLGVKFRR
jgi:glycosyltransferase involved in cell wall biosynthesis